MIPRFFTQNTALEEINSRLSLVGDGSISRPTFYRLRDVFVSVFPGSKWIQNNRLIYSESVVLVLYFLARMHQRMRSFRLTEMGARTVIRSLPTATFSESFQTYSAIDTFFASEQAA